jgi:iron-sulfur cluster repair protein YtfE (RIC family)
MTESKSYSERVLESYQIQASNTATIVGIYKGYTTVLAETLQELSNSGKGIDYLRGDLKYMAEKLKKMIEENEERWNTRMVKKD